MRSWLLRLTLIGVLSWAIPFMASFAFFDRTGALVIPQPLFKSLMVVVFGGVGVSLLTWALRKVDAGFWSGLGIGLYWLAINGLLDMAILVPMTGMTIAGWAEDVGLRYLLIPIMAAALGAAGARRPTPA